MKVTHRFRSALPAILAYACALALPAFATTTDYWIYDSTAKTITDGNWTLKVTQQSTANRLTLGTGESKVNRNAYVSGSGELDLTKPVYRDGSGGTRCYVWTLGASCLNACSELTGLKLGGTEANLNVIVGNNFYQCANLQSVDLDIPSVTTIGYNAFGSLGSDDKRVTFSRIYAPELLSLNWGSFAGCRHGTNEQASILENVYMPKLQTVGGAALRGVYATPNYSWTGHLRLPSLVSAGDEAFAYYKDVPVIELGRDSLTSLGTNCFNVESVDHIIFGNGTNDLDLTKPIFRWTYVKSLYFNGKRPAFPPSVGTNWWTGADSFSARSVRMVIPRNDATWADFIAEAQKEENQPTAAQLAAYRSRYPNCQDPIGKIPGSLTGVQNEQWLSYGNSDALLRDLYVESNVPVDVPGTSPAARVWPTGKWYRATDVEHVVAPADWTSVSNGVCYRAVGYVYERATDTGWTAPVTNAATSVDISFATPGAQRVTWLFERGLGNGTDDILRTSADLAGEAVIKIGTGTGWFCGAEQVTPASVRVDAGTFALSDAGSTNSFYRITFKEMSKSDLDFFELSEMRFTDARGTNVSDKGYSDAAADCAPADMAAKSIWCSFPTQRWYIAANESPLCLAPSSVFDTKLYTRLKIDDLNLSPDDPSTWVQLVIRLPSDVTNNVVGYNINRAWSYMPNTWTLETSPGGNVWKTIDERKNVAAPKNSCEWCNGEVDFPVNVGNVQGGGGIAPETPVWVKSGATFDGSCVGTDGQELAALTVDWAAGGGTLKGVRLASVGTLDILNAASPAALKNTEVPLTFVDAAFPGVMHWTVRVNGVPAPNLHVMRSGNRLFLCGPGTAIIFR